MPIYIDAEKLKHLVNEKNYNARNKHFFFNCIIECDTEDVAPVIHAHWIMPIYDDGIYDDGISYPIDYQVSCSKCGFDLALQIWLKELRKYGADKYCPNCGAKLDYVLLEDL